MSEKQNEQRFSLTQGTLDEILQYLATKPYHEVVQLFSKVNQDIKKLDSDKDMPDDK